MKQNERFLVYAVTGFLALILVVAVVFTRDTSKGAGAAAKLQGLGDILGNSANPAGGPSGPSGSDAGAQPNGGANGGARPVADGRTGVPGPGEVAPQTPLIANNSKPLLAADLVSQQLGPSRRDRNVRFVRAKNGDSLDQLVRRWCGNRDPFLDEAKSLNEDLVVLRVGQEVAVPWVEDEVLLTAIEATKPRTLVPHDGIASGGLASALGNPASNGTGGASGNRGTATPATTPTFELPGGNAKEAVAKDDGAKKAIAAGSTTYTFKKGDSLWKIASRTYGAKNVDAMLNAIKAANPGLEPDRVKVGQKLVLPAAK
jgi:phage tail protein X